MLSLAFSDQVQHVLQPGLNQGCKARPFFSVSMLEWILFSNIKAVTHVC